MCVFVCVLSTGVTIIFIYREEARIEFRFDKAGLQAEAPCLFALYFGGQRSAATINVVQRTRAIGRSVNSAAGKRLNCTVLAR